jgi:YidC/Oxa1 family membrane protein insertase
MWSSIWHLFFFDPVYNGLIFFVDIIPGGDVGIAVILITVTVKLILFPLSIKAAKTQKVVKEIEPKIKEIKNSITDSQEQARAIMALYKESGINPFASILLLFIQIPIVIALYLAVYKGGGVPLPAINVDLLYSFIPNPEIISMIFLGSIDITQKSLFLAILASLFQFIHGYLAFPALKPKVDGEKPSMKDEFARSLQVQMKYVMPIIIGVFAYTLSAIIGLYFVVSSIAAIIQEILIRKHKV